MFAREAVEVFGHGGSRKFQNLNLVWRWLGISITHSLLLDFHEHKMKKVALELPIHHS